MKISVSQQLTIYTPSQGESSRKIKIISKKFILQKQTKLYNQSRGELFSYFQKR